VRAGEERAQANLNSACSKVLVPVKIFQFHDMGNENRSLGTFRGHSMDCYFTIHGSTRVFGKSNHDQGPVV
jgi:hypothetical protein